MLVFLVETKSFRNFQGLWAQMLQESGNYWKLKGLWRWLLRCKIPQQSVSFPGRSSSTKLALYGHYRCHPPRKTVLLAPHKFPSPLLCHHTLYLPKRGHKSVSFPGRSSSTKLALYGHYRCHPPRKTVLLAPHKFPSPLLCHHTLYLPKRGHNFLNFTSSLLSCLWFERTRFRIVHNCACSKCIGRWPKNTTLIFVHQILTVRFIDACASEKNEEKLGGLSDEDRAMAWKQLRPSTLSAMWKAMCTGALISLLTVTVIGVLYIMISYVCYQTIDNCQFHDTETIPEKAQWIRTLSDVTGCVFLHL